jgi:DNA (cytosine-5)-methyltransferase 1
MGYHRAGFEVVCVDIEPIPDNPFEFIQADIRDLDIDWVADFDARHASPPCQSQTALTKGTNQGREYPNLIPFVRDLFSRIEGPSVIENVQGSELRRDLVLCGEMFGLEVIRHRYFELSGWSMKQPAHINHRGRVKGWRHGEFFDGPYFAVYGDGGGKGTVEEWQRAMGIDWTHDRKNLAEAIPPAYTELIGRRLIQEIAK